MVITRVKLLLITVVFLSLPTCPQGMSNCNRFNKSIASPFPYLYGVTLSNSVFNQTASGCAQIHPDSTPAIIRDKETYDFLKNLSGYVQHRMWISLSQTPGAAATAEGWFWGDGVPLAGNLTYTRYSEWAANEPSNPPGALCGLLYVSNGVAVSQCSIGYLVLCEVNVTKCSSNCIPGTFQNVSTAGCQFCPAGRTTFTFGSTTCFDCPSGLFSNYGELSCGSCQIGSVRSSNGTSSCTPCQRGRAWYSNYTCGDCPPGYFSDSEGATYCDFCPRGTWNSSFGATSLSNCKDCDLTSPGIACNEAGSTTPFVKAGYYRIVSQNDVVLAIQCIPSEACLEGGFGNTSCSAAYTGELCSDCNVGYFRLGDGCKKCMSAVLRWIVICMLIIVFFYLCWKLTLSLDRIPFSVKLVFQWAQFLSLFSQLSQQWPNALRFLFGVTSFLNFELQYFGFSCDQSFNFFGVWLLKLFLPIMIFVVTVLMNFFSSRMRDPLIDVVKAKSISIMSSLLFLSTMIFSSLFQIFNCVPQGDKYVMLADPTIKCYESLWFSYLPFALFFILLYVVTPLSAGIFFFRSIKIGSLQASKFEVFFRPYRAGCEYWEMVRLLYRLAFVIIRDTTSFDSGSKTLFLISVLAIELYLEGNFRPFQSEECARTSLR
jgi:hypothetical protein